MKNNCHSDESGESMQTRRSEPDRRYPATIFELFRRPYKRRKSKGRRKTDAGAYIDIYNPKTLILAITVLLLSGVDAVLTSWHITRGTAIEINPFMDIVIRNGGLPAFIGVKAVLTAIPMAIIVIHQEWAAGRLAARVCLFLYFMLSIYHIYLIYETRHIDSVLLHYWI
jgi:hypothetical protein